MTRNQWSRAVGSGRAKVALLRASDGTRCGEMGWLCLPEGMVAFEAMDDPEVGPCVWYETVMHGRWYVLFEQRRPNQSAGRRAVVRSARRWLRELLEGEAA